MLIVVHKDLVSAVFFCHKIAVASFNESGAKLCQQEESKVACLRDSLPVKESAAAEERQLRNRRIGHEIGERPETIAA